MRERKYTNTVVDVPTSYLLKHPSSPHLRNLGEYRHLYQRSLRDPDGFWSELATSTLDWDRPFRKVRHGSLDTGDHAWFLGGRLNACYNCVDRHAFVNPDKGAILYESDTPGSKPQPVTYAELLRDVSRLSWVLKNMHVQKGDIVTVYMPNIPEAVTAMLACARIGAVHSVVFAGFSAPSLRGRLDDSQSKIILTVDESIRGGKVIPMKRIVEDAVSGYHDDHVKCLVLRKTGSQVPWSKRTKDAWWHEECARWPSYYKPESMDAEDPLYLLYTSGSTGKPKGLMHSTAGYVLGCAVSGKYVLDLHASDTMFCASDVGWITGHSYLVYTPLVLGLTTVIFDGTPSFPTYDRYWEILERTKATHFYTAPTSLRLMKKGNPNGTDQKLEHLRVVASIGEPLAANIWQWCYDTLGQQVHVLDTYFQTETGCHAFSPLAAVTPTKPGSVALPFFGFNPILLDPVSGKKIQESDTEGLLVFDQPWPSIARTVWGDHARYMKTYFELHKGYFTTGDAAIRDRDGYFTVLGRVDDVVNVSGHRLSTGEIESALLDHGAFAEVAVVGSEHELTGQALKVFACLKNDVHDDQTVLRTSAQQHIGKAIGRFAVPKELFFVNDLPKTRSGKIMRRILRKILEGEKKDFGDTSTLVRPDVVRDLISEVAMQISNYKVPKETDADLPYPFDTYNITYLDHVLPPCHMFMFLTFHNKSAEGIGTLKLATDLLCKHFPFLAGVVTPSSKSTVTNECEVQPATSSFLTDYPMLRVEAHPEMDDISLDEYIGQQYLPIQFLTPLEEPMPLVRFKANITKTKTILCVAYYHKVLDSTAVAVVLKALSELCKNPNISADELPSSNAMEQLSRQHISDFKADEPMDFNWTRMPLSFDLTPPPEHKVPVSRSFTLSTERITLLKTACNKALASACDGNASLKQSALSSNDIITAIIGLCGNSARMHTVPEAVPSPKVIIAANVRKYCRLPSTYMGNALSAVESSYDANLLPSEVELTGLPPSLDNDYLVRLLNIAVSLRQEINRLSEPYMKGIFRTISETADRATFFPAYGSSIIVSSLRWMNFYLDFGRLGFVQKYDIPENKVKGVCWVLPSKDLTGDVGSQPFELRFVLERAAMELLQEDGLFQWLMVE